MKWNKIILSILVLMALSSSPVQSEEYTINLNTSLNGHTASSNWKEIPAILSIAAGIYSYDQDIKEWAQNNRNDVSNTTASIVKPFGDGTYTVPLLGTLYTYGYLSEDKKAKRTALLSIESFVLSGIIVQTIKVAGHRHRPNTNDRYDTWDGFSFSTKNQSFPSGHSQAAFSIATVIATEYSQSSFIPPIMYSIATLTALSRINDNGHWASDAFVGAAIGYLTAKAVVSSRSNTTTTIIPITDGRNNSLSVIYLF